MVGGATANTLEFAAILKYLTSPAFALAYHVKKCQILGILKNTIDRPAGCCSSGKYMRFQQNGLSRSSTIAMRGILFAPLRPIIDTALQNSR